MFKCNRCDSCSTCCNIWKKNISLHKKFKYNKQEDKKYKYNDYDELAYIFGDNNSTRKDGYTRIIKNDYYAYYNKQYPVKSKNNENVNSTYKKVNNYNDNKVLIDINIIYECFIKELNINKNLIFEKYINYNKSRFKYIETICRFKNKVYRCYLFIEEIKNQ